MQSGLIQKCARYDLFWQWRGCSVTASLNFVKYKPCYILYTFPFGNNLMKIQKNNSESIQLARTVSSQSLNSPTECCRNESRPRNQSAFFPLLFPRLKGNGFIFFNGVHKLKCHILELVKERILLREPGRFQHGEPMKRCHPCSTLLSSETMSSFVRLHC